MDPLYARYPFLPAARTAVEEAGIDLTDLVIEGRSPVLERAMARIDGAIRVGRTPDPIGDPRVELLSYPVARVLISLVNEPVLTDRYALAEARRAADLLREDLEEGDFLRSASRDRLTLDGIIADFDLADDIQRRGDEYTIAVAAYLNLSNELTDERWRLVNRFLADGSVPVTRPELDELLREAIRERVADGLPLQVPDRIASALQSEVSLIERSLADVTIPAEIDSVVPDLFPPCIGALGERLRSGDGLSTIERFAMVSFLAAIGMDEEEVVAFARADHSPYEQLIRYQVRHVHGGTPSTAYPPPSCATMQAAGACVDHPDRCETDDHPIAAYARRIEAAGDVADWRAEHHTESA